MFIQVEFFDLHWFLLHDIYLLQNFLIDSNLTWIRRQNSDYDIASKIMPKIAFTRFRLSSTIHNWVKLYRGLNRYFHCRTTPPALNFAVFFSLKIRKLCNDYVVLCRWTNNLWQAKNGKAFVCNRFYLNWVDESNAACYKKCRGIRYWSFYRIDKPGATVLINNLRSLCMTTDWHSKIMLTNYTRIY